MKLSTFFAATIFATSASFSHASEQVFLEGLSGNWSGSGKAYLKGLGNISASCKMLAAGGNEAVKLDGKCGVLFFKIGLGLQLMDEGENRFTGVYTGSKTGPAKLEGVLKGNVLVMNIAWNGEVNGDRKAQMTLERTGPNSFAQTVTDEVKGKTITTSKFAFTRI